MSMNQVLLKPPDMTRWTRALKEASETRGYFQTKQLRKHFRARWAKATVGFGEQGKRVGGGNESEESGGEARLQAGREGEVLKNSNTWR